MMPPTLDLHANLPRAGSYDVVICGGGTAGWVAALSARRAVTRKTCTDPAKSLPVPGHWDVIVAGGGAGPSGEKYHT